MYLGVIVAIAAFWVAAAPSGVGSLGGATYGDAVSDNVLTDTISAGNWKTVLTKDGAECEGLVFESAEDAEE